jgi:thiamine-monophosphate kinase
VRLGIGDDCAVLRVGRGQELVVTTDLTLEGRHFKREWHPARAVGHRVLARGLSDLAAMGARPVAAFLSLALPAKLAGGAWIQGFLDGLLALAKDAGVELAGGDLSESPRGAGVMADIVCVGKVKTGKALLRSGARAGDAIYVTGALGGAAVFVRDERARTTAKHRENDPHLWPKPRLGVGVLLVKRGLATGCIDVSDGVSVDLAHLCEESGCGAVVESARIPVHPLASARKDGLELALHGGEDYELLFTARAGTKVPRSIGGVKVTRIGRMVRGKGVKIVGEDGRVRPLKAGGWEHFSR